MSHVVIKNEGKVYEGRVKFSKETSTFEIKTHKKEKLKVGTYFSRAHENSPYNYIVVILGKNDDSEVIFSFLLPSKERYVRVTGRDEKTGRFIPWSGYLKLNE